MTLFSSNPSSVIFTLTSTTNNGGNWLTASSTFGNTTPATLQVSVNTTGLAVGFYSGTVTVTAASGALQPLSIPVSLTVTGGPGITFTLSPSSLTFNSPNGPLSQSLAFTSNVVTSYAAASNQSWLQVSPSSSTVDFIHMLAVSINPNGLATGTYSGTIFVTAGSLTQQIPVTLIVAPVQQSIVPSALSFSASPAAPSLSQQLLYNLSQASTVTFAVSYVGFPMQWLTVQQQTSGTVTQAIFVITANPANLAGGTYAATITLIPSIGQAVTVPVTFTVSSSSISVSPQSVALNYQIGGLPPQQIMTIGNLPVGVSYTVSNNISGIGWLNSNVVGTTTGTQFLLTTNPAPLGAGTYSATVIVNFSNGTVIQIPVTLTVTSVGPITGLSPAALNFTHVFGGVAPSAQTLALNASVGQAFSAISNTVTGPGWLSVSPASGVTTSTSTPLTVNVSTAGLAVGTYTGTVSVILVSHTLVVPVTLTITGLPSVSVSPSSLTFNYTPGGNVPFSQAVTLTTPWPTFFTLTANGGAGGVNWLAAGPLQGTTSYTGATATAVVSVGLINATILPVGTYTGTISIATGLGSVTVPVTLIVELPPTTAISLAPAFLSFTHQTGTTPPPARFVTMSTAAFGSYTASSSASWVSISPPAGPAPGAFAVTVKPQSLSPGIHYANIVVLLSGTSVTIPVNLSITTSSIFRTSPTLATFHYQIGGSVPAGQGLAVDLTSTGSRLTVTTSVSGGNWLGVTAPSLETPGAAGVFINATGLAPGTYNGAVNFIVVGQQIVQFPVTLIVSTSPQLLANPRTLRFTSSSRQQSMSIATTGSPMFVTAAPASGSSWLSVTPTSVLVTPTSFTVQVDSTGLASGIHYGAVVVNTSPQGQVSNAPLIVPVEFELTSCASITGPTEAPVIPSGTVGSFAVDSTCAWTATSNAGWITILSGASGSTGPGIVTFRVAPNTGPARTGTITVDESTFTITQAAPAGPPIGLRFVPTVPCRIADTRLTTGPFTATRDFAVQASTCGIPTEASAYSLNVTVVPNGVLSYLTLWPAGQPRPVVSTLNSFDGRTKANAAIVSAGTNGAVSVFVTDRTDVVLDINGYFVPPEAGGSSFYPMAPCRITDTRLSGGPLSAGVTRTLPISGNCDVPVSAQAYSLNFTAIPSAPLGFLSTWPAGATQPLVSTLNAPTGTVTANAAIVPAGTGGAINVNANSGIPHLAIDTNGYFGPPSANGLSFYPVTPCRVSDTRLPARPLGGPVLAGGQLRSIPVPQSACNIPTTARAYSLNATVVPDGPLSFLTLWPTGAVQPLVSTLNSFDASTVSNAAIVPAGANGAISAYVTGPAHLILDVNGYFQ
ncbi:MAG: hypothetical protein HY820_27790 [Acidobacteria bacterium]|nr:hypothetical protein [Acidobacteriota bacterium]